MTTPIVPPLTTTPPTDPVVARLREQQAVAVANGTVLIVGGVVASIVTVAVLVGLLSIVIGLPGLGFTGWYIVIAALFAGGAAVWLKRRENLFTDSAFTYIDPRQEWSSPGNYAGATAVIGTALDFFFIGPRILMAGVHHGVRHEPKSREHFFDRCALLLRQLGRAGEAVKLSAVQIGEDETVDKLSPVLDYLDRHGWIGKSSDVSRLWLSSKAKIDLPRLGVPVGVPEDSA